MRAALALALACCAAHAGAAPGTFVAGFDWLAASNGRHEFADALITLNEQDLERFVPTGALIESYRAGVLLIENRGGRYYGSDEFADPELDVPASVRISHGGRVLLGGKGIAFDIDLAADKILIEHRNGEPGCSVARWYVQFDLSPALTVLASEYADAASGEPCARP